MQDGIQTACSATQQAIQIVVHRLYDTLIDSLQQQQEEQKKTSEFKINLSQFSMFVTCVLCHDK